MWCFAQDLEPGEEAATVDSSLGQAEISRLSGSSLPSVSGLETSYRFFSDLSGQLQKPDLLHIFHTEKERCCGGDGNGTSRFLSSQVGNATCSFAVGLSCGLIFLTAYTLWWEMTFASNETRDSLSQLLYKPIKRASPHP